MGVPEKYNCTWCGYPNKVNNEGKCKNPNGPGCEKWKLDWVCKPCARIVKHDKNLSAESARICPYCSQTHNSNDPYIPPPVDWSIAVKREEQNELRASALGGNPVNPSG